jgi:hypothetical protein
MSCNSCSHSHVVPNIGGVDPSRSRPCHHVRPADFQASRCSRQPLESSGSICARARNPVPSMQIGCPAPIWDVDPSWADWQWSSARDRSHSCANRFPHAIPIPGPFQLSGHLKSTSVLLGQLAKLPKSAIYIYRVSAERIGLGRESGLADDLLQNPISNRRCSGAATRIPVEGRQRTWPQEL